MRRIVNSSAATTTPTAAVAITTCNGHGRVEPSDVALASQYRRPRTSRTLPDDSANGSAYAIRGGVPEAQGRTNCGDGRARATDTAGAALAVARSASPRAARIAATLVSCRFRVISLQPLCVSCRTTATSRETRAWYSASSAAAYTESCSSAQVWILALFGSLQYFQSTMMRLPSAAQNAASMLPHTSSRSMKMAHSEASIPR